MAVTFREIRQTGQFKRHICIFLCLQMFLLLSAGLLVRSFSRNQAELADDRLFAAAALIEKEYPGSFESVLPVLTGKSDPDSVQAGKEILGKYAFTGGVPPFPFFLFCLFALTVLLLNSLVFYQLQRSWYARLKGFSSAAQSILDGKITYAENFYREGMFDLFAERFNKMVNKMLGATEQQSKEKVFLRNIISDISHQLKTPMASLIMYNDLMIDEPNMEASSRKDFLGASRLQLNRMEWLVKSLLKLARLETDTISFQLSPCNLLSCLDRALDSLGHLIDDRSIIKCDLRKNPVLLNISEEWISEALINIVKNAIQHTDKEKGVITASLSSTPLFERVVVRDNGPGISDDDLPRIFERFYKGGNSVDMESVGIGLSLSKMIVEAHGGDISARSPEEGGAEVIITMPRLIKI